MFKKIIANKIIISIVLITILMMVSLSIYIPKVTEKNTVDLIVKNSVTSVEQIKLTRTYYVEEVVGDIKKFAPNIKFDYEHKGVDGKLAFPTSLVHELSDVFTKNTGSRFQLYSNYPFKPKKDRVLSDSQKEALTFFENNQKDIWTKRETIDGKEVLRVAIPDIMTQQACVSCHNSHPDRTWELNKWQIGDKRGVLEIVTPLDDSLNANNVMKNKILIFIFVSMFILVIFYSYSLINREKELKTENDILDEKVKEEVKKNIQKEKQLVLQSRSAAMGDMMAAIIHQWKQPLNGISMSISSLEVQAMIDDLDKKYLLSKLDDAKRNIDIMNSTMNDFKNFFKPQNAVEYNVNETISDTLKLVLHIYSRDGIEIETNFCENPLTIGFPNEISQVLINILNNARDAIVENNATCKNVHINTAIDENSILLIIKDFAGGIPTSIIERVFEPYFTTKSDDKGTGIGLDMSKTIVEKVDGTIEVKNEMTLIDREYLKGATFIIKLKKSNLIG